MSCFCGFEYPADKQEYWTNEEYRRVAEHQRFHAAQSAQTPSTIEGKDYEVPKGMFEKVVRSCPVSGSQAAQVLMVAMNWLAENPISPTEDFAKEMIAVCHGLPPQNSAPLIGFVYIVSSEWQRRMFLKETKK